MSTNYVSKLLKVAEAEVGYLEKKSNAQLESKTANAGYNNYTKYAAYFDKEYPEFYNYKKQTVAWCDMFVDWCFVQAFGKEEGRKLLGQPLKSTGAGCKYSRDFYKSKGQLHMKNPKPGDQIFFYNSARNDIAHTGLVEKVDSNYVYTIEGNTSSKSGVVANGGAVARKSYALTYYRIAGYGRPNFDEEPKKTTSTKSETKKEDKKASSTKTDNKKEDKKTPNTTNKKPKVVYLKVVTKGSSLNCRKKASVISKKLGSFRNGTKLTLVERTSNKWYKVKGKSISNTTITGYCSTKYLKVL